MGILSKLVYKRGELVGDSDDAGYPLIVDEDADPATANLVTSLYKGENIWGGGRRHAVLLDIDIPNEMYESSSWGNSHLYLEPIVPLTDAQLFKLLDVLAECGIIQQGFANASKARGYTALRPPWVGKEDM